MLNIDHIQQAAQRIAPYVQTTPLLESDLVNQQLGGRILFKAECLQRIGAFKIRGALNKLLSLSPEQLERGVVAFSSGNHAQAVALGARLLGTTAKIVMPKDAPKLKINNTKAYGGEVILYDRYTEDREAIAQGISTTEERTVVRPFDDEVIMAGQGTVGLEINQQLTERNLSADALLCPCGGGGLMAGVATAMAASNAKTELFAVEPKQHDDTLRSLQTGQIVSNDPDARSICDSIVTPCPGELTFATNQALLSGALTVSDEQVIQAMLYAYTQLKVVVEPGGCVGLAALLAGKYDANGKTVVVVLSGGNIDLADFHQYLHQADENLTAN